MNPDLLARNNARGSGTGANTMLFVHGLGTSHRVWSRLLPLLAAGHRVVTLDLAGCGGAQAPGPDVRYDTLDGHAEDLVAIASELRPQGRTILVVHSVGAMIGLLAEMKAPHLFDAHIMLCPAPCYQKLPDFPGAFERQEIEDMLALIDQSPVAWARAFAPAATGTAPESPESAFFVAEIARAEPRSFGRFARAALLCDYRSQLATLVKPTLIFQTTEDPIVPVEVGRLMQRTLPDGKLELLQLPGHFPQLLAPDACASPMLRMLKDTMPW